MTNNDAASSEELSRRVRLWEEIGRLAVEDRATDVRHVGNNVVLQCADKNLIFPLGSATVMFPQEHEAKQMRTSTYWVDGQLIDK